MLIPNCNNVFFNSFLYAPARGPGSTCRKKWNVQFEKDVKLDGCIWGKADLLCHIRTNLPNNSLGTRWDQKNLARWFHRWRYFYLIRPEGIRSISPIGAM